MTLGELSLFISEDLYLLRNEVIKSFIQVDEVHAKEISIIEDSLAAEPDPESETVPEQQETEPIAPLVYNKVLFITDKLLSELPEETFKNLVNKGLALNESDFSVITQDKVTFSNPEEVNSQKIILFGTTFTGFQQKYKLHTSGNQLILLADSMDRIAENVDLKKQLWAQLQLMFPK